MNTPSYENYLQRSVIEDDGNTRLYWDNNGFLSYSYNGNNKRLTSPYKDYPEHINYSGEHIRKTWWGRRSWDFHAAEVINKTLKIFSRARLDISGDRNTGNGQDEEDFYYNEDFSLIEIWEYDEDGDFIGMEYPERDNSNDRAFYYNIKSDRQAIADYNVQWFSDLETWLLSDKDLRDAYISETGSYNQPKSSGRLEDYAFEQWNIRNPGETPPNSNGITELTGTETTTETTTTPSVTNNTTNSADIINITFNQTISNTINLYAVSANYTKPSYQSRIYNLGQGKYAIKTDDGVDEITGTGSIYFTDQTLDITNDIKATFDQVTGMDEVSGVIFRLYNAAFARLPDPDGLANWINANKDGGFTYMETAIQFIASQESINRYGSDLNDTDYITTVYNNVLDRDPDDAGLAHYETNLGNGDMSRETMMFAFSESPENRELFSEQTGIT